MLVSNSPSSNGFFGFISKISPKSFSKIWFTKYILRIFLRRICGKYCQNSQMKRSRNVSWSNGKVPEQTFSVLKEFGFLEKLLTKIPLCNNAWKNWLKTLWKVFGGILWKYLNEQFRELPEQSLKKKSEEVIKGFLDEFLNEYFKIFYRNPGRIS